MGTVSREQREAWENQHYGWCPTCCEDEFDLHSATCPLHGDLHCIECGVRLSECVVLALLDECKRLEAQIVFGE